MPGVGIDDFGADFIKYLPGVTYTMRRTSPMRNMPLRDIKWEGTKLVKKLHTAYNTAIADIEDGGGLPPAKKQDFTETEVTRRFTAGSVQVTDGALANAKTTKGAAIRVVSSELKGLLEGMRKREGFMLCRDGTGVVALMGSTVSGATFTVDDARALWPKGDYEIRDATTTSTVHANFTVTSVARGYSSGAATVTPSATLAASGQAQNDLVVWNTGDYSSYGRAVTGLDALIDDTLSTSFQGTDVSAIPWWTSPVFNGGGATQLLSSTLLRQVLATLKQESEDFDDVPGGLMVCTEVWSAIQFEELFEHAVRVSPKDSAVGIKGGVTFQTAFGTITVKAYPDIIYGNMLFINRKAIARPVQKKLDWRPGGTAGIFDRSDRFAAFTATALEIHDLMVLERNTCAKITNLQVSPQTAY